MADRTALFDACVLYPAPLRDLLMHLALTDLFQALWSEAIHEEWMRNVLADRPDLTRGQLERTRDLMNAHVAGCLVVGLEDLIPALALPDPNDRHVLAAAIRGRADVIVTFNLSDFPADVLSRYGIEAQHPDAFVASLLDLNPGLVYAAVKRQLGTLRKPPVTPEQLLDTFERLSLPVTAAALRRVIELLRP